MKPEDGNEDFDFEVILDSQPDNEEVAEVSEDTPPPLETPDKNFDQVVKEVMEGKWGVGQDRRLRLAKAGYDHVAVQKELVRIANGR